MRRRNRRNQRVRSAILAVALLVILWLFWSKVRLVIWIPMPWWVIPLFVIGVVVLLDLVLDRLLGGSD